MLTHLSIENYILIHQLEIDFQSGFTAITGETGAGKSILIGALSLILGKRADTDVLLDKDKKCIIEGVFAIDTYELEGFFEGHELDYEDYVTLRREISRQGKSRAFINDTPVTLPVMKALGERLVNIHSQHQALTLNESGFQLAVVDNYADNRALLSSYAKSFRAYKNSSEKLEGLLSREVEIRAEEDYANFRFEEIQSAGLLEDEQKELEEELKVLSNAEEIKSRLFQAIQILNISDNNLLEHLAEVVSLTGSISDYHQEIGELHRRLESSNIELKDISTGLEQLVESISFDQAQLEKVSSRLDLIYALLQKHKVNEIRELLLIRDELAEQLSRIHSLDAEIIQLKKELGAAQHDLLKLSDELRKRREAAIPEIEKEIGKILRQVGMEKAVMKVDLKGQQDFTPTGRDRIEFLFSANQGTPPAAISRIASGGELSRLMLAVKSLITRKNLLPTIILDEIDMGVSGEIAGKVGDVLTGMSVHMQLIAITHLPQIAGKANEHFKVFKKYAEDRTVSGLMCLSDSERVDEIAAMLSNENVSSSAKETAKELLGFKPSIK
ncbi:MAG: DNA repair protein RecN [Bacteroidetes bacterium]|nr:DNA repair protein RecN [Bacteroidota bacterium]